MSLRALYIDFNSYFASCEQHLNEELRGQPIGIVPMANVESTCCIAASAEAKNCGVKTGTSVRDARKLCPKIQFIQARPREYVDLHHRLTACIESCIPVTKALSIDEMVCELPRNWRKRETALRIARDIKRTIAREVGSTLKSSIGIAPNTFLAKTATEIEKRDGLVVIEQSDLPHALHCLELSDLCGIGRKMLPRLHRAGIRTVEDLCQAPHEKLRKIWGGVGGARMSEQLEGAWIPLEETTRQSIGHGRVLPPKFRNNESARALCHRLLQKAALRLREMDYYARSLSLSVRCANPQSRWEQSLTFYETQSTVELTHSLETLWSQKPASSGTPTQVGLSLNNLLPASQLTANLFETETTKRQTKLDRVMDAVNRTMGPTTLYYGSSHEAIKAVPMRIAFNHIPNAKIEDVRGAEQ